MVKACMVKQVVLEQPAAEATVWPSCGRNAKQVKGFGFSFLQSWGPQLLEAGASGCGHGTADWDLKGISFLSLREQGYPAGMPVHGGRVEWGVPGSSRLPLLTAASSKMAGGRTQTVGSDIF